MHYDTIELTEAPGSAIIRLNRPTVMNALNGQMRAELTDALRTQGRRAQVIVVTGAGRAFCSGQDLGDGGSAANIDIERTLRDEYLPLVRAITECPVPVIAAVNGPAAGAGANLALACDVVIASDDAFFLQAFTKIGLIPDAGGTWFLPRQVGLARAMGAMLFGDRISAAQAAAWGMIYQCVPAAEFEAVWRARMAQLATGPAIAQQLVKTALRLQAGQSLEQQLVTEAELQGQCGRSRDFREGVVAFLDKRPPVFEGR